MDETCPENTATVLATEPDWERERIDRWWSPSQQLLESIRQYQKWQNSSKIVSRFFCYFYVLHHRFWSVITGADIPVNCQLGGGLKLPHPNGIVIHPKASIGVNCLIFQQVTIIKGVKIGNQVNIGAGAKIIRPVSIGDRVSIGANAVIVSDVSANSIAIGIPARVISKNKDFDLEAQD